MATDDDPLVQKALDQIEALSAKLARLKIFVNEADDLNGRAPRFGDVEDATIGPTFASAASRAPTRWNPGEFLNKSFSGAVRSILLRRAEIAAGPSPASVDDIHEALTQGNFNFTNSGADAQKNGIRISLGKNSAAFVRLPNSDLFGLVEWYGGRPLRKVRLPLKPGAKPPETSTASDAAEEEAGSSPWPGEEPAPVSENSIPD